MELITSKEAGVKSAQTSLKEQSKKIKAQKADFIKADGDNQIVEVKRANLEKTVARASAKIEGATQ